MHLSERNANSVIHLLFFRLKNTETMATATNSTEPLENLDQIPKIQVCIIVHHKYMVFDIYLFKYKQICAGLLWYI